MHSKEAADFILDLVEKKQGLEGLTQIAQSGYFGPLIARGRPAFWDPDKIRTLIVVGARKRVIMLERQVTRASRRLE